jgi:hypothetical protein
MTSRGPAKGFSSFPVAYPLPDAQDEALAASERVDNVLFGGYQAVRTMTLLLPADVLVYRSPGMNCTRAASKEWMVGRGARRRSAKREMSL